MRIEFIGPIVTSVIALLGVFVGSKLTEKATSKQNKKRILADYYAEVLSSYSNFAMYRNTENLMLLITAIEKCRLLCSKKSNDIFVRLEYAITDKDFKSDQCGHIIGELRISAKDDLCK